MSKKKLLTTCEAFYNSANKFPNLIAQRYNPDLYKLENGTFTWGQMKDRVEHIACGLISMGFEKQERVGIMAPSSPYWTHADIAIGNAQGVVVAIYPTLSLFEVDYIVNDSECRYLFVGNDEMLERILPGLDNMPTLEKIIMMDRTYVSNDKRIINLNELMEKGKAYAKTNFAEYESRWQSVDIHDWFTILYTSGTTGLGKGVILTHWALSSRMDGVNEYFKKYGMTVNENDVTMSFLPMAHIFDRGSCQWMAIWNSACITYADSPSTLLADMLKYNPTWFNCVPRLYEKIYIQFSQQMAENPTKKKIFDWALSVGEEVLAYKTDDYGRINMSPNFDVTTKLPLILKIKYKIADKLFAKVRGLFGSRFRFAFSASAGISPDLLKFFYILGFPVVEGYGSTESCNACVLNPITACKPGYIGPEANGSKARVAADGELEIGGAGLFIGYLNKDEETKDSFTEDGWFKTGDLVIEDEKGYYKIIDRKKAIICMATGKNVAPAKLEGMFGTSPYVEQVFPVGDEKPHMGALLVPNFTNMIALFDKENIPYDASKFVYGYFTGAPIVVEVGDDFINNPRLKELVDKEVVKANKRLEEFEVIKKYAILKRRFTEETGELTPTQKTKKRAIIENYKDTIEGLYKKK